MLYPNSQEAEAEESKPEAELNYTVRPVFKNNLNKLSI